MWAELIGIPCLSSRAEFEFARIGSTDSGETAPAVTAGASNMLQAGAETCIVLNEL